MAIIEASTIYMNQTKKSSQNLSQEVENKICELYRTKNLSMAALAKLYKCKNPTEIKKILVKNNTPLKNHSQATRKYDLDESFFEKIDSEEKAYFLGFIYADGGIVNNSITLALQQRDYNILERLVFALKTNQPIKTYTRKDKTCFCKISISSKKIINDLHNLGVTPRKSLTLNFPNKRIVPNNLLNHFIRGYFDGDGSLTILNKSYGKANVSFVSTKGFLTALQSLLKNICKCNSSIVDIKHLKQNITKRLVMCGNLQIIKFLNWLYNGSCVYLQRKYEKFQTLLKLKKEFDSSTKIKKGKSVLINGIIYKSKVFAAQSLKLNRKTIAARLNSEKWPNYSLL